MSERLKIKVAALTRLRAVAFGEPVTNVCAGEGNPWRHAFFVRVQGDNVELTDGKGKFGKFGCEVIYPGCLPPDECKRLFEPFWQAQFGNTSTGPTVEEARE